MNYVNKIQMGRIVTTPPGLLPNQLKLYLPQKIRSHARASEFMSAVEAAAIPFIRDEDERWDSTPKGRRENIEDLKEAAFKLRVAMQAFSGGNDSFDLLQSEFDSVLVARNDEQGLPLEGRPVVPALPTGTPKLSLLLERITLDLKALDVGCSYVIERVKPNRNHQKGLERQLAVSLASVYLNCFGHVPQRGAFAPLVAYVGDQVGLKVGADVLADAVTELKAQSGRR